MDVLLRPHDVLISDDEGIECEITERAFRGAETLYTLHIPGDGEVLSLMPSHCDFLVGQRVKVALEVDHLVLSQG